MLHLPPQKFTCMGIHNYNPLPKKNKHNSCCLTSEKVVLSKDPFLVSDLKIVKTKLLNFRRFSFAAIAYKIPVTGIFTQWLQLTSAPSRADVFC